ncbi:MAG: Bug family tripartite tricarboxylate transporter substrate binding protein [Burkholderiales bacterium]
MSIWKRVGPLVATAAIAALMPHPACAQTFPAGKPIRFIVGFPPGGAVDLIARAVAPGIGESLGTTVVVDNRAGANGAIGAELLAKSLPDGTSIGLVSISSLVLNVHMMSNPTYHTLRDFTPISNVGLVPFAITTHPAVPATTLKELIAIARSSAGRITVGSPGTGSLQHLTIELLNNAANVKILHVPYKGTGPAMTDVMGGHIDGMITAIPGVLSVAKSGKLRVLAVTGEQRASTLPEVPTAQEQGLKGFIVVNWYAIVGPANLPAPQLNALHGAIVKTVASSAVRDKLVTSGVDPKTDATPGAFGNFVRDEFAKWEKVVRQANVRAQ